MTPGSSRLVVVLGIIAALLAWGAAGLRYSRHGTIDWAIIGAGAFCAAMAISAVSRTARTGPPSEPGGK